MAQKTHIRAMRHFKLDADTTNRGADSLKLCVYSFATVCNLHTCFYRILIRFDA